MTAPLWEVYSNVPTNDGPTWGFRCLACHNAQDGYLKAQYAEDEGRQHVTAHSDASQRPVEDTP